MVAEVVGTTDSVGGSELPFTARAQRALERAARFSRQSRAHEVDTEHVLLGVLDVEGLACQVLRRLDVDMAYLQGALTDRAEEPIPDQTEPAPPAVMTARVCCPSCQVALDDNTVAEHVVHPRQEGHTAKPVALIYCTSCGTALGAARP